MREETKWLGGFERESVSERGNLWDSQTCRIIETVPIDDFIDTTPHSRERTSARRREKRRE